MRDEILDKFKDINEFEDYPDNGILAFIVDKKDLTFYMPTYTTKIYFVKEVDEELEETGIVEDLDQLHRWLTC